MIDWDAQVAAARARHFHGHDDIPPARRPVNACPTCDTGKRTIDSPTRCRQCVIDNPAPRPATR